MSLHSAHVPTAHRNSRAAKRSGFRNLAILAVLALLAGLVVAVLPNPAQAGTDADNDGSDTPADCNDNNPLIKPGGYDIPDLGSLSSYTASDTDCDTKDGSASAQTATTSTTDAQLQTKINTACAASGDRQVLIAGTKTYGSTTPITIPASCDNLIIAGGYNDAFTARSASNVVTFTGPGAGLLFDGQKNVVLQLVTITGTTPSSSSVTQGVRQYTFPTNNIDLVGTPTVSTATKIDYSTSTLQSVRWAGYVVWPDNGTVTITANTDDGSRVWVNGNLCVNSWKGQVATDYSCTVSSITSGTLVPVQYDYMNNNSTGVARLDWAYGSQSRITIPAGSWRTPEGESTYGLRAINGAVVDLQRVATSAAAGTAGMGGAGGVTGAQGIRRYNYALGYLEGYSFDSYVSTETATQINTTSGSIADRTGIRWIGYLIWPLTGTVTMHTNTDDGTRLWVGGSLVIDDWTTSAADNKTGTTPVSYAAGQAVPFVMDYFEKDGGDIAQLAWEYTGKSWSSFANNLVPAANFRFPEGDYAGNPNGESLFLSRGDGLVGGIGGDGCPGYLGHECGSPDGRSGGGGGLGVAAVTGLSEGSPGTARTGGGGGTGGEDDGNGTVGNKGTVNDAGGGAGGAGGAGRGTYDNTDADPGVGGSQGGLTDSVAGAAGAKGANTSQNTQSGSSYEASTFNGGNGGPGGTGHAGGGGGGGGGSAWGYDDNGAGGGGGGGGAGGGHSGGQGYAGGGSFGIWAHNGTIVADSMSSASAGGGGAGGAGARGGTGGFGGRGGAGGRCDNGQNYGGGGGGGGGAGGYGGGGGGGAAGGPSYGVYGAGAKVRIGFTATNGSGGSGGTAGSAGMPGTPGAGSTSRGRAGGGCNAGLEGAHGNSPTAGTAGVAGDAGLSGATNGLANAAPDLSVAVSGVPASMTAGQASSFTVTVTNNGGSASTASPTVTIPLATGMAFNAAGSTAGCSGSGAPVTVTCSLTSIAASGGTQSKTISVIPANVPYTTPSGAGPGAWQGFRASVGTDTGETHTFDNDSRNNNPTLAGTATQILKWADLTVTSATSPNNFRVGVDNTFTVNVSNSGGKATATGSSTSITLPSGVYYKNASGTGWTCPDYSSAPNAGPITCTRAAGDGVVALPALTVTVQPRPQAVGSSNTTFATTVTEDLAAGNNSLAVSRITGHGVQGNMLAQIIPPGGGATETYTVHFEIVSFPSGTESDRLKIQVKSGAPPGGTVLYENTKTLTAGTLDDNFVVNPTNSSQCSPATASPGGVCYNFVGANATAPKIRAVTTTPFSVPGKISGTSTVKVNVLPLFSTSFSGSIQISDTTAGIPGGSATYWVYPMFNPSTTSFYTG